MAGKKSDFLTAARAAGRSEQLEFPEIGYTVFARALSAADVRRITASSLKPGKKPTDGEDAYDDDKLSLAIVAASIVDEQGARVIPEGREADLSDLPNAIYTALQQAALRVNGMGGEAAKKA